MHGLSGCIVSARFDMWATVLRQYAANESETPNEGGYYEYVQDEVTGSLIREWHPSDPDSVDAVAINIPCSVRGITDGGIRAAGTTERFDVVYLNIDWARMRFPADFMLTDRDRVTNIRDSRGKVIWVDAAGAVPTENPGEYKMHATVFNVNGVTPVVDPFGEFIENVALLEKTENTESPYEVIRTYA